MVIIKSCNHIERDDESIQGHIPFRRVKFWLYTITYIILTFTDLLLTYKGTPDLSNEYNPLVRTFGFGWTALILVNIVSCVLIPLMAYACFIKYKRIHLPCNGLKEYFSMLHYGRPDKFIWWFYKTPTNKAGWMNMLYMACFASIFSILFARLIVIIDWSCYLLLKQRHFDILWFWRYKISLAAPIKLHLLVAFFSFLASLFYWIIKEYLVNKKN